MSNFLYTDNDIELIEASRLKIAHFTIMLPMVQGMVKLSMSNCFR